MAELSWGKTEQAQSKPAGIERLKFLIGGALLLAAVGYLIISGTTNNVQYFMTVDELVNDPQYIGKSVRISGAVIGETIQYDSRNLIIDFTIANIPADVGTNLALTLHNAVLDTAAARLPIHIENQVMPDLLQNEAQAILTGSLGEDGVFYATELLLKCPSRYEESVPEQVAQQDVPA